MPFAALRARITKAAQIIRSRVPLVPVLLERFRKFAVLDEIRITQFEPTPARRHANAQPPIDDRPMKHGSPAIKSHRSLFP
jgi:hypothetical protein